MIATVLLLSAHMLEGARCAVQWLILPCMMETLLFSMSLQKCGHDALGKLVKHDLDGQRHHSSLCYD